MAAPETKGKVKSKDQSRRRRYSCVISTSERYHGTRASAGTQKHFSAQPRITGVIRELLMDDIRHEPQQLLIRPINGTFGHLQRPRVETHFKGVMLLVVASSGEPSYRQKVVDSEKICADDQIIFI